MKIEYIKLAGFLFISIILSILSIFFTKYTMPVVILYMSIFYIILKIDIININEKNKKTLSDINTLFGNQKMLLSLINSVRTRLNTMYGKTKKQKNREITDLGEEDDGVI